MKYSLRSLMMVVGLGPPALAILWWLRHTWLVEVLMVLVLMVAGVCISSGLLSALIAVIQRMAGLLFPSQAPAPNPPKP
jgi:hypothetical protein